MGHDAGDLVLSRFAERLRLLVRPGRYGGAHRRRRIHHPGARPARGPLAEEIAQRLLDGLADAGRPWRLCFGGRQQLGLAVYPQDGTDGRTLLKNADTALYRAKAEKGGYRRFEACDGPLARRAAGAGVRPARGVRARPARSLLPAAILLRHAAGGRFRGACPLAPCRARRHAPDVFIPLAEECA